MGSIDGDRYTEVRRTWLQKLIADIKDPPDGKGWCRLELLGHRVLYGFLDEVELAGAKLVRVRSPNPERELIDLGSYGPAAIYCYMPMAKAEALIKISWVQTAMWGLHPDTKALLPASGESGEAVAT